MVPETISAASITDLQQAGLSMSKITYLKDLSDHYIRGVLGDDVLLATESLEDLKSLLLPVKGIGPWTVDMFAIFHLKRADVLPVSDLGVRKGMQKIYGLKSLPNPKEMKEIAERWKPYQSLGTWFCWRVLE
jgi:DNA-3-methyladenine glycosylase II